MSEFLPADPRPSRGQSEHSYKFQRLRERIRESVASGELNGKLPGERALARRFEVNAKTLSKALTDLAAEGLLTRSIGRGTFVKGAQTEPASSGRWLLVCDGELSQVPIIEALRRHNQDLEVIHDAGKVRPSFINKFSAVVDLARNTSDAFIRNLLVRNIPLVSVGTEPRTYSTNTVLLDTAYLAGRVARDLLLAGHRSIAAVESKYGIEEGPVTRALRAAAGRYAPETVVLTAQPGEIVQLVESGLTGLICESTTAANLAANALADTHISVPGVVSIAAVGRADTEQPCSGFFLSSEQEAEAIVHLLEHARSGGNPTVLWLTGKYLDLATTGAAPASASAAPPLLTLTA